MKGFLFISISILTFCVGVFAQTDKILPCPTIEITETVGIIEFGKVVTYIANVSEEIEKFNVKYKWDVKDGEIIEGQGTNVIKAKWANFVDVLTYT